MVVIKASKSPKDRKSLSQSGAFTIIKNSGKTPRSSILIGKFLPLVAFQTGFLVL